MDAQHKSKWINERQKRRQSLQASQLLQPLLEGDLQALSSAITLLESQLEKDQRESEILLQQCLQQHRTSLRIGITGVPGVGKSSFIEVFGMWLIEQGKSVAVLAIDPSSAHNEGSILGDKTRMSSLSAHPKAFVRPSPTGGQLGGVARKTRESILLCEAAGFDVVLVETVGVGQSEVLVHSMVDVFLLLMLAGAGDELQGIKRGIMELADLLIVNKADGGNLKAAQTAARSYKNALHLFPPKSSGWTPVTTTSSSLDSSHMGSVWEVLEKYVLHSKSNGWWEQNRRDQEVYWFKEEVMQQFQRTIATRPEWKLDWEKQLTRIKNKELTAHQAAREWFKGRLKENGI